jgi:thiol-disulfide isomerase/thioredoxin
VFSLPACGRHPRGTRAIPQPAAVRRPAAAITLAGAAVLALAACTGGPIAANTAASNGQSFVSGSPGTTVYPAGQGPLAPRVAGTTLGGARLRLSQFRGHVVVMNFWGSWCSPCRSEAPVLAALARADAPAGVRFLGVDIRDQAASAKAFLRDFRISYPSLSDPADVIALAFRDTVPPSAIPTTLVIARDGRISARVFGAVSYGGLRRLIRRAAAAPA